ncbi:hypothetical protein O7598_09135 [Micromonospora sp. WMMC241]|uniref:hypothetical protein n=1 Tax=Micromonospora sp. WMMC241 TaxID=3015159 RepID=UPI0022B5FE61|nr:hypothetical protein [Micromonospora sp. WMMC241]MCZ7436551.1 hypothetical protein [Micromonospora sp. WMMC241]
MSTDSATRRRVFVGVLTMLAVFAAVAAVVALRPDASSFVHHVGTALIVGGFLLLGVGLVARSRRRRAGGRPD